MKSSRPQVLLFALFLIIGMVSSASGQAATSTAATNTIDWETLRPDGEEFSVQMPKGSTFESGKEPYHKMELNTRYYVSRSPKGPIFAIVSLSGIKSNPALYTELQRFNSYVDAFKTLFVPRIKKDAVAKLTLVGAKSLAGHQGREYKLTIGELAGNVHVFATRRRFYALAYLDSKKDEAVREQFLSSFWLPEKVTEAPTVAAQPTATPVPPTTQPANPNSVELNANPNVAGNTNADGTPNSGTQPDPTSTPQKKRAPISGGVLNGKAISLPKPDYPEEAKTAGASGAVAIQVLVDEGGMVMEAKAISGHPLLQQICVTAALQARFSPTSLMGEPVKVSGVIVYNFARQ